MMRGFAFPSRTRLVTGKPGLTSLTLQVLPLCFCHSLCSVMLLPSFPRHCRSAMGPFPKQYTEFVCMNTLLIGLFEQRQLSAEANLPVVHNFAWSNSASFTPASPEFAHEFASHQGSATQQVIASCTTIRSILHSASSSCSQGWISDTACSLNVY